MIQEELRLTDKANPNLMKILQKRRHIWRFLQVSLVFRINFGLQIIPKSVVC